MIHFLKHGMFLFLLISSQLAYSNDTIWLEVADEYMYDDKDNIYVTPDQQALTLQLSIYDSKDLTPDEWAKHTVKWKVKNAEIKENKSQFSKSGNVENTLILPHKVGEIIKVSAKVKGPIYNGKVKLEKIKVYPGLPHTITVEQDDTVLLAEGHNEKTFTFFVTDQYGNSVHDNTLIWFRASGSLSTIDSDYELTDGHASITVKGDFFAEMSAIEFKAQGVLQPEKIATKVEVDVQALPMTWDVPSSLSTGESTEITLKVTDLEGNPVEGVSLILTAKPGRFSNQFGDTDKNGTFKFRYFAPDNATTAEFLVVGGGNALKAQVEIK